MNELLAVVAFIYVVGFFICLLMFCFEGAAELAGDSSKIGGGLWAIKLTALQGVGLVAALFWPISIALIIIGFKITDTLHKPTV